jgi:hypothetical protein
VSEAQELREAARLMRQRAQAATPGPWEAGDRYQLAGVMPRLFGAGRCSVCNYGGPVVWSGRTDINGRVMDAHKHLVGEPYDHVSIIAPVPDGPRDTFVVFGQGEMGPNLERADAEHIAGGSPELALVIADLVDDAAHQLELSGGDHSGTDDPAAIADALRIARTYMRSGS